MPGCAKPLTSSRRSWTHARTSLRLQTDRIVGTVTWKRVLTDLIIPKNEALRRQVAEGAAKIATLQKTSTEHEAQISKLEKAHFGDERKATVQQCCCLPATVKGTASPAYETTIMQELDASTAHSVFLHYESISYMSAYEMSSFEELRVIDYAHGRHKLKPLAEFTAPPFALDVDNRRSHGRVAPSPAAHVSTASNETLVAVSGDSAPSAEVAPANGSLLVGVSPGIAAERQSPLNPLREHQSTTMLMADNAQGESELLQLYRENRAFRQEQQQAQREVERLGAENAELREQSRRLKEAEQRNAEAEEQITKHIKDLSKLRDQVATNAALSSEVGLPACRIREPTELTKQQIAALKLKIQELEASNDGLKKAEGEQEAKNTTLQTTITYLKSSHDTLQKANESLRVANQTHEKSLRESKEKIAELEKRLETSIQVPTFGGVKRPAPPAEGSPAKRPAPAFVRQGNPPAAGIFAIGSMLHVPVSVFGATVSARGGGCNGQSDSVQELLNPLREPAQLYQQKMVTEEMLELHRENWKLRKERDDLRHDKRKLKAQLKAAQTASMEKELVSLRQKVKRLEKQASVPESSNETLRLDIRIADQLPAVQQGKSPTRTPRKSRTGKKPEVPEPSESEYQARTPG
ncbi:hypothetical protein AURDEDRAFT_127314 [Auricularia subglabra TFB-10046 SS5]|nr:hypothetical protein AURDEDRAFT_127314 [Auricularia subglabra TFB-10046 SS5]